MGSIANVGSDTFQITVEKMDGSKTQSFSLFTESDDQVDVELAIGEHFEMKEDEKLLGVFSENQLMAGSESSEVYFLVGKENSSQLSIFGHTVSMSATDKFESPERSSFDFHFNELSTNYQCGTNYEFRVCIKLLDVEQK